MNQSFKSLLKNYIKDHKNVTLNDLDFLREGYNRAEKKGIKFSTMERMLRDIVKRSEKNYDLLGYKIVKTTNDKKEITGYLVIEKPKELIEMEQQRKEAYERHNKFCKERDIWLPPPVDEYQAKLF